MPENPPAGATESLSTSTVHAYVRRALLALVVFAGSIMWLIGSHGTGAIRIGEGLGDVRAELADGSTWQLADHRGEIVVLNFWATWCGPCRMEAPVLSRLHRDGITVLGLATDPLPVATVAAKARALGMDYPVGKGAPGLLERLGISSIPTNAVIGRDGKVVFARTGAVPERVIRRAIADAEGP